jgi:hypothetical protein
MPAKAGIHDFTGRARTALQMQLECSGKLSGFPLNPEYPEGVKN